MANGVDWQWGDLQNADRRNPRCDLSLLLHLQMVTYEPHNLDFP